MNFFTHIIRVALAVGLVMGLILFSALLYISDFGARRPPEAVPTEALAVAAEQVPPAAPEGAAPEQRAIYWVFGQPEEDNTP